MTDLAFAAGFASVRSFNATIQEVYATTPSALRVRSTGRRPSAATGLTFVDLTLAVRRPFCPCNVFGHLIATAIEGVEAFTGGSYHRTLRLPVGHGVVSLRPTATGSRPGSG
nr:AlkA N-terminal domain-containing protein [Tessaracoccus coleopterorum]